MTTKNIFPETENTYSNCTLYYSEPPSYATPHSVITSYRSLDSCGFAFYIYVFVVITFVDP